MKQLYNFGITQDDYKVEAQVLALEKSNLLCIASGGETPLSFASLYDCEIKAIDIAEPQLKLCRLKLMAAVHLNPHEAPGFLGLRKMDFAERLECYLHLKPYLLEQDAEFWEANKWAIQKGVVNCARFEGYIRRFAPFFLRMIGKNRLNILLEIDTISEQEQYFDKYLDKSIIRWIFEIVFSPVFYRGRGMEKRALQHASRKSLAKNFYGKFRQFLVSTKASENMYLQYYLLGEIRKDEALPPYLKPENRERLRQNLGNITFMNIALGETLKKPETFKIRNFALSNVSDWISEEEMKQLLLLLSDNCVSPSNICLRYLHKSPISPESLDRFQMVDLNTNQSAVYNDRFPFYSNYFLIM